jgi:transcriptional regulator with XRE-family HTH domain
MEEKHHVKGITMEEREKFRERFREERVRLGYGQKGLADELKLAHKTVNQYETGKSAPGIDDLYKFAELGADLCFMVTGRHLSPAEQVAEEPPHIRSLVEVIVGLDLDEDAARLLSELARRIKPAPALP